MEELTFHVLTLYVAFILKSHFFDGVMNMFQAFCLCVQIS